VSRYDKYDPMTGGFRAPLAANFAYTASLPDKTHADLGKIFAVSLNTSGQVLKLPAGASQAFAGVLVLTRPMAAGDIVDVMTDGEMVEVADAEVTGTTGAGLAVFTDPAVATGVPTITFATNGFYIGRFVETARLVVRCSLRSV
jgi:hypothetical protein